MMWLTLLEFRTVSVRIAVSFLADEVVEVSSVFGGRGPLTDRALRSATSLVDGVGTMRVSHFDTLVDVGGQRCSIVESVWLGSYHHSTVRAVGPRKLTLAIRSNCWSWGMRSVGSRSARMPSAILASNRAIFAPRQ